jgi:hypothetical protein
MTYELWIFHTHHPLGDGYAYEEQKSAARRRTRDFLIVRLPKFLGYFERVLELNRGRAPRMVGRRGSALRYFCEGTKSSSTALRIRSGGSRPSRRMKS